MTPTKNDAGLFEVKIEDQVYEFEKWGADESTDVLLDLVAIAGKPLSASVVALFKQDESGKVALDKEADKETFAIIIESLSSGIGANKALIKSLMKKLASERVLCSGQKILFNTHYQDRLDLLFKVIRAALEVQYGNFFAALLGSGVLGLKKSLVNRPT